MRNLLLNILLAMGIMGCNAIGTTTQNPAKDLTYSELPSWLDNQSKVSGKKIFVSKRLGPPGYQGENTYVLQDAKCTQVLDWLVWHHPLEDVSSIADLASENMRIIAKHAKNHPKFLRYSFGGAEIQSIAKTYSHVCGINFYISQTEHVWAIYSFPTSENEDSCLDFGFFLAGHGIQLVERDGVLFGVTPNKSLNKDAP